MKRWQLVLMRSILAIIAVFLLLSFARYQIHHDRVEKVNDMMDAALPEGGYYAGSLREYERAKIYEDTDGWHTVTVALADWGEGDDPAPLYRDAIELDSGNPKVRMIAGLVGYPDKDLEVILRIECDEPRFWDFVSLDSDSLHQGIYSSRSREAVTFELDRAELGDDLEITISFVRNPNWIPPELRPESNWLKYEWFDPDLLTPYFSFTADLSPLLEAEGL